MTNAFTLMPACIRESKEISSSAKILWCQIAAYNYSKIYKIKNITLSKDLNITPTQISRLLSILSKKYMVNVFGVSNERRLIVVNPCNQKTNEAESKKLTIKGKIPQALVTFYESLKI